MHMPGNDRSATSIRYFRLSSLLLIEHAFLVEMLIFSINYYIIFNLIIYYYITKFFTYFIGLYGY